MQILEDRLKELGVEAHAISPFIRDLAKVLSTDLSSELSEVNQRLRSLGWDDLEVDYRTLELATACFELERVDNFENDHP